MKAPKFGDVYEFKTMPGCRTMYIALTRDLDDDEGNLWEGIELTDAVSATGWSVSQGAAAEAQVPLSDADWVHIKDWELVKK